MLTLLKRYWPVLLALAGLSVAMYGCYRMGWQAREAKQTAVDLATTQKALTDFLAEAKRINGVAGRIERQTVELSKQTNTHTVEYRTHEKLVPLSVDCRPDAGRLQHIDAAVTDANTAVTGKPNAPLPTH